MTLENDCISFVGPCVLFGLLGWAVYVGCRGALGRICEAVAEFRQVCSFANGTQRSKQKPGRPKKPAMRKTVPKPRRLEDWDGWVP